MARRVTYSRGRPLGRSMRVTGIRRTGRSRPSYRSRSDRRIVGTTARYATRGEGRGVLRNVRRGTPKQFRQQVRTSRSQVRRELGARPAKRMVRSMYRSRAQSAWMRNRGRPIRVGSRTGGRRRR